MSGAVQAGGRSLSEVLVGLARVPRTLEITDLSLDSRRIRPGAAFLACRGRTTHGLRFAAAAVASGARAVIYEPADGVAVPDFGGEVLVAAVDGLSRHVGLLADRFFGEPSRTLTIAGITGTNGKSTCAWLLAEALAALGRRAAYLGTLGTGFPPRLAPAELTTPDAVSVQRELAALRAAGAEAVAMEVSSHALDQERVAAVRFRTAAFTNLSRDHLDYHGTMQAYAAAKARLFAWETLETCVLNADDEFGRELARRVRSTVLRVLTTRRGPAAATQLHPGAAWVHAASVAHGAQGLSIGIESSFGSATLATPLVGEFNVDNALTTLAILLSWQVPLAEAARALGSCAAPPGRMETFGGGPRALAIVDYAHTPDALAKALQAARGHCRGRLHLVFGCGGDRDRGKRPMMAAVAAQLADELIITDDNPRSEDPARIFADIRRGLPDGTRARVVPDRAQAIRETLAAAGAGDVVLVAGKGHEDYQIIGTERRAFSDREIVRAALGGAGP